MVNCAGAFVKALEEHSVDGKPFDIHWWDQNWECIPCAWQNELSLGCPWQPFSKCVCSHLSSVCAARRQEYIMDKCHKCQAKYSYFATNCANRYPSLVLCLFLESSKHRLCSSQNSRAKKSLSNDPQWLPRKHILRGKQTTFLFVLRKFKFLSTEAIANCAFGIEANCVREGENYFFQKVDSCMKKLQAPSGLQKFAFFLRSMFRWLKACSHCRVLVHVSENPRKLFFLWIAH